MEDLAVFTDLNHSGSFRKTFVKFKKNKYVIYRLRTQELKELNLTSAVQYVNVRALFLRQYSWDT